MGRDQLQRNLAIQRSKEGDSPAQKDRDDCDAKFVDQILLQKWMDDLGSTANPNPFPILLLERFDQPLYRLADELNLRKVGDAPMRQYIGLFSGIHPFPRREFLRHLPVSIVPHHDGVDLPKKGLISIPRFIRSRLTVQPIDPAVFTGNITVQTGCNI